MINTGIGNASTAMSVASWNPLLVYHMGCRVKQVPLSIDLSHQKAIGLQEKQPKRMIVIPPTQINPIRIQAAKR